MFALRIRPDKPEGRCRDTALRAHGGVEEGERRTSGEKEGAQENGGMLEATSESSAMRGGAERSAGQVSVMFSRR